jgi:tetratricopeptide (TPR) repeat protein
MKRLLVLLLFVGATTIQAQTNTQLLSHYEAYYTQMKKQGDRQGIINALTHLNIISPNQARKDTLAYVYANSGQYAQALNTIGFEKVATDSDMAVETKAVALKALNEPQRAAEQYEVLFSRKPNPYLAYTLTDLKLQLKDVAGAEEYVNYGLANAKDDMKYAYYESQPPYEVPMKAAFTYLKAMVQLNKDQTNLDPAIAILDEAIKLAPNFNLAILGKQALENRKNNPQGNTESKN